MGRRAVAAAGLTAAGRRVTGFTSRVSGIDVLAGGSGCAAGGDISYTSADGTGFEATYTVPPPPSLLLPLPVSLLVCPPAGFVRARAPRGSPDLRAPRQVSGGAVSAVSVASGGFGFVSAPAVAVSDTDCAGPTFRVRMAADAATVSRAQYGTAAAAHSSGAAVFSAYWLDALNDPHPGVCRPAPAAPPGVASVSRPVSRPVSGTRAAPPPPPPAVPAKPRRVRPRPERRPCPPRSSRSASASRRSGPAGSRRGATSSCGLSRPRPPPFPPAAATLTSSSPALATSRATSRSVPPPARTHARGVSRRSPAPVPLRRGVSRLNPPPQVFFGAMLNATAVDPARSRACEGVQLLDRAGTKVRCSAPPLSY